MTAEDGARGVLADSAGAVGAGLALAEVHAVVSATLVVFLVGVVEATG